ncbi:penicillin-binding protein [Rhizobiaceae bacterium n13]|uniref:Penicillin-binding protein n=1 Tax=Ferirhizobium litorale TaxID=2927786 RepID=A0AAE3QIT3_9HYPH|nr:transglycosylase domain-containing protein [Fererhizobium litorale]MDI7862873.1 penicillin-binding protein [Fererhizobium litorale]MDI7923959.1 penicillin-binding protein [Fererhizobium litorale]
MAGRNRSHQRIEPSFVGSDGEDDDDLRLDASDRVAGGGVSKTGSKARKQEKPTSREKSKQASKQSRSRRQKKRGIGLFALIRFAVYWCIVLGIWVGIGVGGLVLYYGARMPSASTWAIPDRPPNVKITAVDGTVIANRGGTGGEALSLENMSPYIPQAVIAIEDRRFYSHFGVDPLGLARAMVTNVTTGRMVQGGSTLTQQLAKNLFLSPERTLERKVQEVLLALWLEHKFTKDQILAMYLNRVFFGSNAYGVEAASRRYFHKSARDVNLGEAALLAGLLKAPSRLSPARDPQAAEARAQVVLGAMREEGFVTESEIKTAMSQPPAEAKSYWSGAGHYVADMVMDELPSLVGDVKEDLVIDTTIDPGLESAAEKAIVSALQGDGAKLNASQAALVSIDGTGAIRALVGGKDYAESQFNRAVKAKRQPGSAFKPFVYAAALEMGLSPGSVRADAPVRIGKWTPENYDQKYRGNVTLSAALAESLNTIAAQLVMEVGPDQVAKLAHRLGIESELQANASLALGTSEVSLMELTASYAPFMNGGYKATPHVIRRVSTAEGKVLYENTYDSPPRVLSEAIVTNMNAMMTQVVSSGTGKKARLSGWQVAGKTGTTQSFRDALFVGFTSNLTTGVWFGNDDGKFMKKVTGGGLPAVAWHDFMSAAHKGLSPAPIFGGGRVVDETLPWGDPASVPQASVGGIIPGDVLDAERYPQAAGEAPMSPAGSSGTNVGQPENQTQDDYSLDPGLVPPADVGAQPPVRKRTTLLDIIMGQ